MGSNLLAELPISAILMAKNCDQVNWPTEPFIDLDGKNKGNFPTSRLLRLQLETCS